MKYCSKQTFLVIVLVLSLNKIALSLDKVTHKFLNETIVKQGGFNNYLINNLGFAKGIEERFKERQVIELIAQGGVEEDEPLYLRSRNHFHNPSKSWDQAGLTDFGSLSSLGFTPMSSVLWAQDQSDRSWIDFGGDWSWKKGREYFYQALTASDKTTREESFAKTFRAVGQIMHLVEDASVPAHVRNDTHIWGDGYEAWVRSNHGSLNLSPTAFDSSILNETPNPIASIPIAKIFDTDKYTGTNPSTSLSWGIAEYTNSNFASDDTIFTENFNPNHKHYFPYPRYNPDNYEIYEIDIPPNKKRIYIRKKGDGEPIERFATAGPLYKYLSFDPALQRSELKLDLEVHSDYAKKLIPRAVGYSAGLLNYFFRGDIDMIPDDTTGTGYVIVNNIDEDMNGTFELWYDNTNDERRMVWNSYLNVGSKSSGSNKSTNITFTPPTDAKEPGRYMLVFKGKLGNEEDAVVGKEIIPPLIFLHNGQNTLLMTFDKNLKLTPYPPSKLTFENAGLSGIETTPATIQSDKTFTEHYYMPSTIQNKKIPSDKFKNYGRLFEVEGKKYQLGNRNSFTPTGWDKNSPLQYNTDLSYFSYPLNYISSGRHNWAYSGDNVIKNLEVWKETDNTYHIRYTTKDGVIKGNDLPFSDIYAVLSPTKVVGISNTSQRQDEYTLKPGYYRAYLCASRGEEQYYIESYYSGYRLYQGSGKGFYFGDVVLSYNENELVVDFDTGHSQKCPCPDDSGFYYDTGWLATEIDETTSSPIFNIKDYDNINEDETFIVMYTKTGERNQSKGEGASTQHYGPGVPYNIVWWSGSIRSYHIAYRLKGGDIQQEEISWNGYVRKRTKIGTGDICDRLTWNTTDVLTPTQFQGQAIFNPSSKVFDFNAKTYIVYSYSIYDYIGDPETANFDSELLSDWRFNKRIVGLIDAETGQKSETEITDVFLGDMYKNFDKTLYGAMGFNNGSIKE
ncbi:MAG: hypothetical protein WA240_05305 [Nitrospirota bacterium]